MTTLYDRLDRTENQKKRRKEVTSYLSQTEHLLSGGYSLTDNRSVPHTDGTFSMPFVVGRRYNAWGGLVYILAVVETPTERNLLVANSKKGVLIVSREQMLPPETSFNPSRPSDYFD